MRAWAGLLFVAIVWQGCGRNGLDDPINSSPSPNAGHGGGAGAMAGHGGAGAFGTAGATGSFGTGGHLGTAGASGSFGTGGHLGTAGVSGTGGIGGTGGQGGVGPLACVPGESVACACPTGDQGAQVCDSTGTFGACSCVPTAFARIRDGMVGAWVGTETNPFTAAFQVLIVFTADGRYQALCHQMMSCPAPVFYYGTDANDVSKTYHLTDLHADGTGTGSIVIFFAPQDTDTGLLDEVTLSADGQRLQFQFWATWGGGNVGPFVFDLRRTLLN